MEDAGAVNKKDVPVKSLQRVRGNIPLIKQGGLIPYTENNRQY